MGRRPRWACRPNTRGISRSESRRPCRPSTKRSRNNSLESFNHEAHEDHEGAECLFLRVLRALRGYVSCIKESLLFRPPHQLDADAVGIFDEGDAQVPDVARLT